MSDEPSLPDESANETASRQPGIVYTFYSYKGGVGRSMALANVGTLLALSGKRVLLIDWDLEAPGLETYFRAAAQLVGDPAVVPGVVDLLEAHVAGQPLQWTECLIRADFLQVSLDIMSSGRRSTDYRIRVQKLDWESMYREHRIGNFVNALRDEWRFAYDFVLIDSRTGFTDIGDICTVLLPDAIVLMFVTNYQNVEGIKTAMARAVAARKKLPLNRNKLHGIPLPARDEVYNEYDKSLEWKSIYAKELGYLYEEWLPEGVSPSDALNKLFIPYVTNWSFGERIPVLENSHETQNPTSIGAAYSRLANLLATELDWYSLEAKASVKDLQATQIELQRERARIAKLEEQRAHMWRLTALSIVLAIVVVLAVLLWEKPPAPKQAAASAITAQKPAMAISTDLYDGRRLLEDGKPDEALKVFEARRKILTTRLASNPPDDEKVTLQTDYDLATSFAGDALLALGRSTDALAAYKIALDERTAIAAKNSDDNESQRQLAIRHSDVGNAAWAMGNVDAAQTSYRIAAAIIAELPAEDAANARMRAFIAGHIGSALEVQGKLDEAMRSYKNSARILAKLIEANPADNTLRRNLSVTEYQIGNVLRSQGRIKEAMTQFRALRETSEALSSEDPGDRALQRYLSIGNAMIAEISRDMGSLSDAGNAAGSAYTIAESLAAHYPAETIYRRDLAARRLASGAILQDQGFYDEALRCYRQSEAIMQELTALDPANADWQGRLAVALSREGDVSTLLRKFDDAAVALEQARAIMKGVVDRDPSNLDALSTLSFQYKRLGSLNLARKRAGSAIEALGTAEDMAIVLVRAAPLSAYWRRHFLEITRLRSEALLMNNDVSGAQNALELAQRVRQKAQVTKGSEVYWEPETARLDMQEGDVLVRLNQPAAARTAFEHAAKTLLKVTDLDPTNVTWRTDLAKARQRIESLDVVVR